MITAHIANMGLYAAGFLKDTVLEFPTTTEKVQEALKRIGVDGVQYEEYFIPCFESGIAGLSGCLSEYAGLDELNHLACLLSELDLSEVEVFEAVLQQGDHTSGIADLINLTQNLNCFTLYPCVYDDDTLGRIYVDAVGGLELPARLQNYIDYEAYGRDARINENGCFVNGGYLTQSQGDFNEQYHGPEDIPAEHRVFAFPKRSVRERLSALKGAASHTDRVREPKHRHNTR